MPFYLQMILRSALCQYWFNVDSLFVFHKNNLINVKPQKNASWMLLEGTETKRFFVCVCVCVVNQVGNRLRVKFLTQPL